MPSTLSFESAASPRATPSACSAFCSSTAGGNPFVIAPYVGAEGATLDADLGASDASAAARDEKAPGVPGGTIVGCWPGATDQSPSEPDMVYTSAITAAGVADCLDTRRIRSRRLLRPAPRCVRGVLVARTAETVRTRRSTALYLHCLRTCERRSASAPTHPPRPLLPFLAARDRLGLRELHVPLELRRAS